MRSVIPLLLLMSLALVGAAFPQSSGAKVYVEETSFDYGYLPGGESVSHTYYLYSRGTDSLKILKVQPGCGCTKAPLKKEIVPVGDSAGVELVFTSSKGVKGHVSKSATVTCNDNDRGSFQLVFKGQSYDNPDSLSPLTLSESAVKFSTKEGTKETKLLVRNVSKSSVKLNLVDLPADYFRIEVPDSEIKPGKSKEIKVKLNPTMPEEGFKKSFTFAVDDSSHTRYTVPVTFVKTTNPEDIKAAPQKKIADKH